jgi:hypothetical protein
MKKTNVRRKAVVPAEPVKVELQRIENFSELEQLCNGERDCVILVNGQPRMIGVRSLTPAEDASLQQILRKALPPRITGGGDGGEDKWDLDDPDYKQTRERKRTEARAMAIYLACPTYRRAIQEKLGPTPTADQIVTFVQGAISEKVVERIYASILEEDVAPEVYADFFSKRV